MKLITKETDYAIRAVINLAKKPGRFVPSGEISAEDKIPLQFLRRILHRLLKAGLVVSREGVGGGVSLKARPEKIRVLDIMNVFQGQVALSECMFRRRICANRGTCVLRQRIKEIEGSLTAEFAGISIADLLRGQACRPARLKATLAGRPGRSAIKKRGVK